MRKSWTQIKNETMTKPEQRRACVLSRRYLAQMELAELRDILQVSQNEMARRLKVTQAAISRLERRPNVLLESISSYVRALGGELELRVVLPNGTIKLTHLLAVPERSKRSLASRTKSRRKIAR